MFIFKIVLCLYLLHFSTAFYNSGRLFGFVYGYQRLCFCRCGIPSKTNNDRSGRLLGGDSVAAHTFPWLALIYTGSQVFGGTLISDRQVITAASLLHGVNTSSIIVTLGAHNICGANGGTALNTTVEAVIFHNGFSSINSNNDIALLRIRHAVTFNQYIAPICLPVHDFEYERIAWVPSWIVNSTTSSCTPRVSSFPILSSRSCSKGSTDFSIFTSDKGCLGPLGHRGIICKTDIGAAVMTRWAAGSAYRLVGVISSASCVEDSPPLYTKIFDHSVWIRQQIRNDCQCL